MQKQELVNFLKDAAERITLSENNIAEHELLKSEQSLLNKIRIFLLVECEKKRNHAPLLFSDFLKMTHLDDLHSNIMSTHTGRQCAAWLASEVGNNATFMREDIKDIPLQRLMYLDKRYYDIDELLSFMQSQQAQGKHLFENPESQSRVQFSKTAKRKLLEHPTTQAYLLENSNERFNVSMIPEDFFNLLHEYLCKLHELGLQNNPWHFSNLEQECTDLRDEFIANVDAKIPQDILLILDQIKIHIPLANGQDTEDLLYTRALKDQDCVIAHQIFLWAFLQKKRPDIQIPKEVYLNPQAMLYQLHPSQQSSQPYGLPIDMLAIFESLLNAPAHFGMHDAFGPQNVARPQRSQDPISIAQRTTGQDFPPTLKRPLSQLSRIDENEELMFHPTNSMSHDSSPLLQENAAMPMRSSNSINSSTANAQQRLQLPLSMLGAPIFFMPMRQTGAARPESVLTQSSINPFQEFMGMISGNPNNEGISPQQRHGIFRVSRAPTQQPGAARPGNAPQNPPQDPTNSTSNGFKG